MISEKQLKILAFPYSKYDTLICDGAIRSGKTSLMSVAFFDWAMREFSGRNFIILGYTYGAAVRNIIDPYIEMSYAKKRYRMKFTQSARGSAVLTIRRGSRVNYFYVFGADNARAFKKIQGFTAAGVLADEVALIEKSAFDQALARCSVDGARYWFSCNPANPHHWFYTDWILKASEQNALYLHFLMDDNPALSEATKARFARQYSGVFADRYIRGLWVVAEGLVYPLDGIEYQVSDEDARGLHTDRQGRVVEGNGEWYISVDYGTLNPFAAILWRVTQSCAYAVDVYYYNGREERPRTDAEHHAALEELAGKRPIESIIIDPSAGSFKAEINAHDRFLVQDADNTVIDGIATTYNMLRGGQIKISEKCTAIIEELGLYQWDSKANKDTVIKEYDHAMDAMRYFVMTVLRYILAY